MTDQEAMEYSWNTLMRHGHTNVGDRLVACRWHNDGWPPPWPPTATSRPEPTGCGWIPEWDAYDAGLLVLDLFDHALVGGRLWWGQ